MEPPRRPPRRPARRTATGGGSADPSGPAPTHIPTASRASVRGASGVQREGISSRFGAWQIGHLPARTRAPGAGRPRHGPGTPINDDRRVGCWAGGNGASDGRWNATSSPPGDRACGRVSLPGKPRQPGSGKWILRVGSAEGDPNLTEGCPRVPPIRVDRRVTGPRRMDRSSRESARPGEEQTRVRIGPGKPQVGTRHGPTRKGRRRSHQATAVATVRIQTLKV